MKSGTKVYISSFPPSGEVDWSQTGVVCPNRRGASAPDGWLIIRFDDNRGCLCVHTERLRAQ